MSVYRVTEFTTSDIVKSLELCETFRSEVAAAGAESIDVVSVGEGKCLVVAKYASEELMETATEMNKAVFGKLIAAGLVDGESISGQAGAVLFSF